MADDLALDLGKKKKTKKTIKLDDDEAAPAPETGVDALGDGVEELNLGTKKKKRAPKTTEEVVEDKVPTLDIGIGAQNLIDAKGLWPDYTYEEALTLVFQVMKDKNPDFAGDKKKFAIKLPEVGRAGSKKTAFSNFLEICRLMKRQDKHVLQFLLAELGTTGSIDGSNCLIVKGRWQQKHFESVLRKYIKEYVMCHTCKSPETQLTKDTRLFFLQCNTCGSRCSVTAIKSGFKAVVGKRAAIRRATEATAGK
ncbi:CRE-IFTB-1 protein [Caenorhabditis remanei]|uniref:Eukaryotic translation initiation factor 2 subunit 2 n=1 Tax=Caenorhabditis remanei TaxID=31234 RepID=E3MWY7_CAERE|nr:CRE-IFTB-1 protein [Caenorhabditis remanei]